MFRFGDLALFVRAAALSSFSDAAREVGAQPAQVSSAIKRPESALAIRLLARSTRSLRLAPEGEVWLPYARQMLDVMHAGLQKIQTPEDEVLGTLQTAVPSNLGRNLLLLAFQSFRRRYSALRLRIFLSDQVTDVFKGPVDVAFRYGNTEDASYVALSVVADNRRVLVASPEWAKQNDAPQKLGDLIQFNVMTFVLRGRLHDRWVLMHNGEISSVQVSDTIMSDDTGVTRRLAIAGESVVYKSWLDVSEDVRDGRLQLLIPDYQGEKVSLNMICPHREQLSIAVCLLHETMKIRRETLT